MVTDFKDRALSCILFVASCLGINDDSLNGKAATNGWKLSRAAHANMIFKKETDKSKILDYLKEDNNINNNYLVWSGGHIMLFSNGSFHESTPFTYRFTNISNAKSLKFFCRNYPLWVSGPVLLRKDG